MKCKHCQRERRDITDPGCAKGGYCEWEEEAEENVLDVAKFGEDIDRLTVPPTRQLPYGKRLTVPRSYVPVVRIISSNQRRESLCPFEWSAGFCFQAMPQILFRPSGLIIWGAPPMASVEQIKVGNCEQLIVSYGRLPARFFSSGDNFAAIMKLLAEGKEYPSWGTWDTCEVGNILRIVIRDKDDKVLGPEDGIELLVWGITVR